MRTTEGPQRVDVIYRRIDDDFLDPLVFRPDSMLGVPGLMAAYQAGNVTLANAAGTGIADDKAVYTYVPDMIRFFLGEEPILKNVPTWRCREATHLAYVLDNIDELVVKDVNGSGGYGMLVGPHADKATIATFAQAEIGSPPTTSRSRRWRSPPARPSSMGHRAAPCRSAPLRADRQRQVRIVPGGLTRVALKEGSLVVNSSQGGGTKDTWVLGSADMLSPHRRQPVLARALRGARGVSRAHAGGDAAPRRLPHAYGGESNEWESAVRRRLRRHVLRAISTQPTKTTSATFSPSRPDNPSSIRSCLETARTNARAVRTALTVEMWEAINGTWLELQALRQRPDLAREELRASSTG